jgi:hypothetical protein
MLYAGVSKGITEQMDYPRVQDARLAVFLATFQLAVLHVVQGDMLSQWILVLRVQQASTCLLGLLQTTVSIALLAPSNRIQAWLCAQLVLFHSIKHLQVVLLASGLHVQLALTKNLEMFRHVNHVMLALFKPHL